MTERKYILVHLKRVPEWAPMSLTEVAARCGVHPELISRFVYLGLVDPVDRCVDGEYLFDAEVVPLIRKIMRLRNQLGVNYSGVGVVLELMRRVETLEARIRELERDIFD